MSSLEKAKKRALRILGSRNLSEKELTKRLIDKGESAEDAEAAVAWLVELKYVDDDEYASQIVRHYSKRGYGEARVRDELYRRGIPRELWDDKLGELDEVNMEDVALEFLNKKLRGSTDKDDLRRATDALVRRGFSYDDARRALNSYVDSVDKC